ncbi:precorrin-3B synthase [Anabaena sphaerica FACHB-251]|uniref:Precorrin-3B synthase n=1 Tax=Anabaena sphaerica FACHB-251 TaxID=2692883 RepID=A0A927A3H3_9NOST|nr:precorrin-3B synthase [Anabaena sphaerica]MBD2296719.1 precorrin-3B synthase [Anabaena sphaerica FACHB-251]
MLSPFTACPGLFYTTPAQDGILSRLRIPGGILNSEQFRTIANIADNYGGGYVDVTNRANLQIREIKQEINIEVLQRLQKLGLGSINPAVDHIRNIMTSPTAGIDTQELIDTRPLVKAWDEYMIKHSHLGGLSAKFSVCFDGGGKLSVKNCPNDITFIAVLGDEGGRKEPKFFPTGKWGHNLVYLILHLCGGEQEKLSANTGILLTPEECIPVLAALAQVYLQHTDSNSRSKPRLREVIHNLGREYYLQLVQEQLSSYKPHLGTKLEYQNLTHKRKDAKFYIDKNKKIYHLGIHRQKQVGLFYIGIVLPLGRLQTWQMRGLADLAAKYGSGNLRLTPWQNLLITDIPQQHISEVETEITHLGLGYSAININSALVSCSGKQGCAAAATDTKSHALTLGEYLETQITLDSPINIHFSGCVKSCAQHHQGDITFLGVNIKAENETLEGYQVYLGDDTLQQFGRQIYENVTFADLPQLMNRMLKVYQIKRVSSQESFREFANRYDISELKQLFSVQSI